jgi:transposase InsO family protein
MKAGGGLTIARMVELGSVSRASFYRYDEDGAAQADRDMDLRDAIQRIALEWPSYGRPRITATLRRQGWTVNPKRVYRLLREDNLLCVRKRKFLVTTDSRHGCRVYPNLAGQMVLTGINQLWVADITYIRLETEFVYLAVVIDAFSRRVIGWALDRTLENELTLAALRMALELRRPSAGWVHHSDSWQPVCIRRLHGLAEGTRLRNQHEPQGESLGKWRLRVVDENPEMRRGVSARVPQSGRGAGFDCAIHREGL